MPELTHLADLIANLDDQGLIQDQLDQIYCTLAALGLTHAIF